MGPSAKVFLKSELTDRLAIQVDAEICALATKVIPSRKGRDWQIWVDATEEDHSSPIHIHLYETSKTLLHCEDELIDLEKEPAELPSYLVLSAGCNQLIDRQILERVIATLAQKLDGIATVPTK